MNNKNHTLNCYHYCNRIYDLIQKIEQIEDQRVHPSVKLPTVILTNLFSLMSGLHSFKAMEDAIKDGDFDKFFKNTNLPSADTISYALKHTNLDDLRKIAVEMNQKARYNKSLNANTIDGLKVVAIDGSNVFSIESERLGQRAHKYEHNDGKSVKYHEKMIAASYVGEGFAPILKMERIDAGEGELTAAKKLVRSLNRDHHQYCDVIVVDSLYINAPFINTCLRNNKDVVVRVKQENNLREDAEGLTKNKEPDHIYRNIHPGDDKRTTGTLYDIKIWDEENFNWSDVDKPLRVLKVEERKKVVNKDGEIVKEETTTHYFATTMEKIQLKALTAWKIAHRRWDEENSVFHWLKTYWNFDHVFSSDPHVIQVMYYIYLIAYNLFHLYIYRNLRSFDFKKGTKKTFLRRFYKGLILLNEPLYYPGASSG